MKVKALAIRVQAVPLAISLGLMTGLASGHTVQESAEELHRRGVAALEDGDLDEAKKLLKESVELEGENAAAWNDLGRAAYALGDYEDAAEHHKKASELDPETEDYMFRQGIAFIELNDFDRARQSFETVLDMNPNHRDSWNDLGFVFNRIGEYETAIPHFDKTIELDPDIANPRAHRGFALLKLGKLAAAEADLVDAKELNDEYNKNYFYWACLHARRGATDAALNDLETAVDKGFKWADWIESETSLAPLRTSPRYDAALRKASKQ